MRGTEVESRVGSSPQSQTVLMSQGSLCSFFRFSAGT